MPEFRIYRWPLCQVALRARRVIGYFTVNNVHMPST